MKNVSKLVLGLIVAVVVGAVSIVGYIQYNEWEGNKKIITTIGKFNDGSLVTTHDILEGSIPFGAYTSTKLIQGICAPASEQEVNEVTRELLVGEKILQWHIVIHGINSSMSNIYIIDKNLVKNKKDVDFTSWYFTDNWSCERFKVNNATYLKQVKTMYEQADVLAGRK